MIGIESSNMNKGRGKEMRFKGNSKQLKIWLDALIIIFGQDAKMVDLKNISCVCRKELA